jgi:hypothetical protein
MKRKTKARKELKNAPVVTQYSWPFYHENTPPPLVVQDGSLEISSVTPLTEGGGQKVWSYAGVISSTSNEIAHIKVIHGSGNVVYMDLDAAGSTITLELYDSANGPAGKLDVTGGPSQFQIVSQGRGNGTGQLNYLPPTGTASALKKHKYIHNGAQNGKAFRLAGIIVTKPSGVQAFNLQLPPPSGPNPFVSHEFRILVWFAD